MQTITLNIGLKTSLKHFNEETRGGDYALHLHDQMCLASWVANTLDAHSYVWCVQESNTERTLVIRLNCAITTATDIAPYMLGLLHISNTLNQDCIAVYNNTTDYGVLVGGYSHEWGEFNKEYFLQYKGE